MSDQQDEKRDPTSDEPEPDQGFQTIWGIKPKDRVWFSLITIIAGTGVAVAVIIIGPMLSEYEQKELIKTFAGITSAYTSAGFAALVIINVKEAILSIAEHIRNNTKKNRMITMEKGRRQGREQTIKSLLAKAEASGNQELIEILKKEAEQTE